MATTNVLKLNPDGLQDSLSRRAVVLFAAPWCGFCKRFKPTYAEYADVIKTNAPGIHVTAINMDKHGPAIKGGGIGAAELGRPVAELVKGFPTVLFTRPTAEGQKFRIYDGKRTVPDLIRATREFFA